jgi:hypothetical protein
VPNMASCGGVVKNGVATLGVGFPTRVYCSPLVHLRKNGVLWRRRDDRRRDTQRRFSNVVSSGIPRLIFAK